MNLIVTVAILVAIAGLVWIFLGRKEHERVATEMPDQLLATRIWAKEKDFAIDEPVPLRVRIDEAFIDDDGLIWLSETKSRGQPVVYESDVLQLSACKVAIERKTGMPVSERGYVRLLTPVGNEFKEVRLLSEREVVAAAVLYDDLRNRRYPGERTKKTRMCGTCAYAEECKAMA